jgi:hypothetical protein
MANLNLNHHVLSESESQKYALKRFVHHTIDTYAGDEHKCNVVVAGGRVAWRFQMKREFKEKVFLDVPNELCDYVFDCLELAVRRRYGAFLADISAQKLAGKALDVTEQDTPLTDLEIIDSLELDSAGTSDDGRRALYGRDGAAEIEFEKAKDDLRDQAKRGIVPWLKDKLQHVIPH